jgi:peptidyl-tRNA hydrolase
MSSDINWSDRTDMIKKEVFKPDETRSSDTKIKTEMTKPTLYQALDELIEDFSLGEKKWRNHDIIKGLDRQGMKGWNNFIVMNKDDVLGMTMDSNGTNNPLPLNSVRTISRIKQLIWRNMDAKMSGAKLASTYTNAMIHDYTEEMNSRKRNNASYNMMTSGIPSFTGPATSTKSADEKRYDAWNRKTLDKTKFDILKEDKQLCNQ